MQTEPDQIAALADQYRISAAALRALIAELRERCGGDHFYVFWNAGGSGGSAGARSRTVLCFRSPDSALAFAQRNRLGSLQPARLRRLSLLQIVAALLRTPAIGMVVLADEPDDHAEDMTAGKLPEGLRLARADLLERLGAHGSLL
jgi:hypothetical protein